MGLLQGWFVMGRGCGRQVWGEVMPERTLSAVDLPMPLVPSSPSTDPVRGVGSPCSLNELYPAWGRAGLMCGRNGMGGA